LEAIYTSETFVDFQRTAFFLTTAVKTSNYLIYNGKASKYLSHIALHQDKFRKPTEIAVPADTAGK
jgi:hypothetical protein